MAVKIGFNSAITFGASGSFYSSEILLALAAGAIRYLSQNTLTLVPLPNWLSVTLPASQSVDIQYSPDAGTTWFSARQGTGNLIFADTAGSYRIVNTGAVLSVDVRLFAIKQA
jgi:hypothetical protein